jgi:hypothetical protein
MLATGVCATLDDLPRAKDVAASCVNRMLQLTLLALEIVDAILDVREPEELWFEVPTGAGLDGMGISI